MNASRLATVSIWLLLTCAHPLFAIEVPPPESELGFKPGADYRLANWDQVVKYFNTVDRVSDRVALKVLGDSTEKRPLIAAFVSSPETIANLDKFQEIQKKLSDPRKFSDEHEAKKAVKEGKPVVVISCSIHSTETASTLMAMELLDALASSDDPETLEILNSTILILIPSANPDGVDKVATWYEQTKGKPWEGAGMVELYHKYAGHDTNRDWFMLNLRETQLLTHLYYKEWFPTVLYDVHQMGSRGARLFVPPFFDPINPNLDPRMNQAIFAIGAHMASDLATHRKQGVLTNAMYDNWWNGGNRTTPQRHNIVAVLTEAASVKMASPIFVEKAELKGITRGFSNHEPAVNFVDPWDGGWWRLRDIVDYELICARSLLTLAARYHDQFEANLAAMAKTAIADGTEKQPRAWIVPQDQRDPGTADRMIRILGDSGIEIHRAKTEIQLDGQTFPAGTWVLPAAQPYRPHLKDMMERQVYPNRLTEGGKAETPYDVAGWTLPLQMGVRSVEAASPIRGETEKVENPSPLAGRITNPDVKEPLYFSVANTSNDDFRLLNALLKAGVVVNRVIGGESQNPEQGLTLGALKFPSDAKSKAVLDEMLPKISSRVTGGTVLQSGLRLETIKPSRVALYQPWVTSMDEGWTRLTLEAFDFDYATVHNADIRAGNLKSVYDVVVIPSISQKALMSGYAKGETDPLYEGGLGVEGIAALRAFLRDGGRLVCLDSSTEFAIEALNLPVKSVLKGLSSAEFYAPGSIVRAETKNRNHAVTWGIADEVPVYFDHSFAFAENRTEGESHRFHVLLKYAASNPLESGWLLGASKLAGQAALIEVTLGEGKVVLFGFSPEHRGQTHGTFRLLFNSLLKTE